MIRPQGRGRTAIRVTEFHVTETGLDGMERYVAGVRSAIGYEVPLAVDPLGHVGVEDCIKKENLLPIVQDGFIEVPDGPGLGIESLNDEVICEHLDPGDPGLWEPTDE